MAARPSTHLTLFPLDDVAPQKSKAALKKNAQSAQSAKPAIKQAAKQRAKGASGGGKKSAAKRRPPVVSAAHRDLEEQLQRSLGTRVVLVDKGGAGTITIGWHGYDHLEALRAKLGRT